jgi:SAM-dependent methyltransferase
MGLSISDKLSVTISHYTGEAGRRYYEYQSRFGDLAGQLAARKFAKYIGASDVALDFGCGGGFMLKSVTCRRRLGVEINPFACETAENHGITCYESLGQIENETVDVAISHHSLEHVPSPLLVLRQLQLKLKPGGLLLIVVPIDDWRTQRKYVPTDINHHLYTWTPLLLGHLLYEAGFDVETLSTSIGINGWFSSFPRFNGKVPKPCLDLLLRVWSIVRRTREILCVVRKPQVRY